MHAEGALAGKNADLVGHDRSLVERGLAVHEHDVAVADVTVHALGRKLFACSAVSRRQERIR